MARALDMDQGVAALPPCLDVVLVVVRAVEDFEEVGEVGGGDAAVTVGRAGERGLVSVAGFLGGGDGGDVVGWGREGGLLGETGGCVVESEEGCSVGLVEFEAAFCGSVC